MRDIGVDVKRDTDISPAVITVPNKFMTDLASTLEHYGHLLHHLMLQEQRLYTIYYTKQSDNTDGKKGKLEEDKELIKKAKVIADKIFLMGNERRRT